MRGTAAQRWFDQPWSACAMLLQRATSIGSTSIVPIVLRSPYAYQVLLLDELNQQGVEVIFLNRPLGQTPEDQLLLQVQGVIAEYERAKFLERSRRGKWHAAQEILVAKSIFVLAIQRI